MQGKNWKIPCWYSTPWLKGLESRMPKVLNKKFDKIPPNAIYVGRPSKWGNPYKITKYKNRETVIHQYYDWLLDQTSTGKLDVEELRGRDLVCWCTPEKCHADILLRIANH